MEKDTFTPSVPTVLAAYDGSDTAEEAVDFAAEQAHFRRCRLLILTVDSGNYIAPSLAAGFESAGAATFQLVSESSRQIAQEMVAAEATRIAAHYPDLVIDTAVETGDPRRVLETYAASAELAVLGSRGLGPMRSLLLGSVGFWATRHIEIPLAIVRPRPPERKDHFSGIAVGISPDGDSQRTLLTAFADAERRDLEVVVGCCQWDSSAVADHWAEVPPDQIDADERDAVTTAVAHASAEFPAVKHRILFARGTVQQFLTDLGQHNAVLYLGRRHSSGWDFLGLGTVASTVIERAVGVTVIVPSGD